MKAVLRHLHSPDVTDLATWRPEHADDFGFLLQIFAGPADGPGQESFDVTVCTPRWLARRHEPTDIISGQHLIIVFSYDFRRLKAYFEQRVDAAEGASWEDVAHQLSQLGHWEFDEYRPSSTEARWG